MANSHYTGFISFSQAENKLFSRHFSALQEDVGADDEQPSERHVQMPCYTKHLKGEVHLVKIPNFLSIESRCVLLDVYLGVRVNVLKLAVFKVMKWEHVECFCSVVYLTA